MKAAIYCRLSEEDKNKHSASDDSGSIQNQKAMLLQYAGEQGWDIYDIYSDDDYAGADRRRPEFNRLLRDAEQHRFDIVLCKTQSRFTRELELVETYLHGLFPVWGIRFVSVVDNADTASKGNKKSRQINGLVNEWYLEDMSENIRSVLTNRRQNGYHIGSFALYGYRKDPERKGCLVIDEEAAGVVREVFALFSQGYGKTAIARILNDRGIPNPTEYKRLHGLKYRQPQGKNGALWSYSAVSRMLTNEIYIGNMVQGKYGSVSYKTKQNRPRPKSEWYCVEGTHEPVIEKELWDRVQAQIARRTKPCCSGTRGLFAGKARCAGCGYTMRSSKTRGKTYLKCPSRHMSKAACPGAFISVDKLEQAVLSELQRILEEYLDREGLERREKLRKRKQNTGDRLTEEASTYRKRAGEYSKVIQSLYMDKVRGLLSERDYLEMSEKFTGERGRLERLADDADRRQEERNRTAEAEGRNFQESAELYRDRGACPEHLTREVVEILIDYIIIGRRISGTRDVPIEIHWNF